MLLPSERFTPFSHTMISAYCAPLPQAVLRELLLPRQWKPSEDRSFFLDAEQVNSLCDQAERIFMEEPTVLRLRGECCLTTPLTTSLTTLLTTL